MLRSQWDIRPQNRDTLSHKCSVRASCSTDLCERSPFLPRGSLRKEGLQNQPSPCGCCGGKAGFRLLVCFIAVNPSYRHGRTHDPLSFCIFKSTCRTHIPCRKSFSSPSKLFESSYSFALMLHVKVYVTPEGSTQDSSVPAGTFPLTQWAAPTNKASSEFRCAGLSPK